MRRSLSVFSYSADRGTNAAYFLGAVCPLVALGVVIERYVLSPFTPRDESSLILGSSGVLGVFFGIGLLSLSCFLVLRRLVRQTIEENRKLALYDSLTGLPNRRRCQEKLERAIARTSMSGGTFALCFIDLDGFKHINDTLGHRAGDQLLMQVAIRIKSVIRFGDWINRPSADELQDETALCRFGGDEFTLILNEISSSQDAARVARRILATLDKPFTIERQEITVGASIGISTYPADGSEVDTLLRNADTAMYAAKSLGKNNFQFYSRTMNEEAESKIELERRLRRAIAEEEFSLQYQPIRHTASGEVDAAEVLLRWRDPELGWVAPGDFVPLAEETGLIVPVGSWLMKRACDQAQAWRQAGYRPIRVAVNVSGRQIREPGFVRQVADVLAETGLDPQDLELEITESTIMQEDEATDTAFRELHELGVQIALDDFGTGYSSLSYLRRFSIHRVKIDRSFVARIPDDPEDMAVTAAIVAMAHHLLIPVVGEGVETIEQARSLTELGCDELQGFLLSPPLPAAEFEHFLRLDKAESDDA
jgi:diguanylate cyclase (GGDEF)-like protein